MSREERKRINKMFEQDRANQRRKRDDRIQGRLDAEAAEEAVLKRYNDSSDKEFEEGVLEALGYKSVEELRAEIKKNPIQDKAVADAITQAQGAWTARGRRKAKKWLAGHQRRVKKAVPKKKRGWFW